MSAPFVTTHRLRFCDTDRLGHVNNTVFAVMLEQGRSEMALEIEVPAGGGGHSIVIVRLELDFRREMTWPGDVRIETGVLRIGSRSFTLQQRLVFKGEVCATAVTVMVVMDRAAAKAVSIEPWRPALERWIVAGD